MMHVEIIILVNLIAYFRVLKYGYIIDDLAVKKVKEKNFLKNLWLQFSSSGYSNPETEHLIRLLNHIVNAVLIYFVFGANDISFWAALLWSINPINTQGVCWLNGSGYAMAATMTLTMLLWPKFAVLSYVFMFWWHLTAVFAPLLFIFTGPWQLAGIILLLPVIGVLTGWRIPFGKTQDNATMAQRAITTSYVLKKFSFKKLIFVAKTFGYYFWLSIIPAKLGLFHTFGYAYGLTKEDSEHWERPSAFFWFSLATISGILFLILRAPLGQQAFGLIWFCLLIAQFCNLVTLQQTITDRYCYLPSIGLMYFLAYSLHSIHFEYRFFGLGALFTFYITRLSQYLPAYRSLVDYSDHNVIEQPDSFAAWNAKGLEEKKKGRAFSSIYCWAHGLRYKDNDFRLNANMASAMKELGLYEDCYKYFNKCKAGMPAETLENNKRIFEKEEAEILKLMGKQKSGLILPR